MKPGKNQEHQRLVKILIIAGGTGGHIFPALTIADALKKQGIFISWLGAEKGMERQLVGDRYPLHLLPVTAIRGKGWLMLLLAPFRLIKTVWLARKIIQNIQPDIVLGMGGYVSGPGCLAARTLRIPLMIHEQNAVPGLTNRVLAHFSEMVFQAFPNTFSKKIKAITTGNPVRDEIFKAGKTTCHIRTPLHILVLGGSQGAKAVNTLVTHWLLQCDNASRFLVWHQTGERDFDAVKTVYCDCASVYRVMPFIVNMAEAYQWADIVIARSGALTVSELMAVKVPSILIPFPHAVDDHQYANAKFLENMGAAIVVRESECAVEMLDAILKDTQQIQCMREKARAIISRDSAQQIIAMMKGPRAISANHVFCIGIGGIGVSGLAELLYQQGKQVSGSDLTENVLTRRLQSLGVEVFDHHDASHITNQDLVVYTSAASQDNLELKAARAAHIACITRGELLARVMQAENNIIVAGTHGKTTTSGVIAWVLEQAQQDPTFVIGGVLRDRASPMRLGGNRFFVAESDESDASFLLLSPTIAVITNIDADHLETYANDFERLKQSFLRFAEKIPSHGFVLACIDDPVLREIIPHMSCRVVTYGFDVRADYQISQFQQSGLCSTFHIKAPNGHSVSVQFPMPGLHNALNVTAVWVVAHTYQLPNEVVLSAFRNFPGMGRRFHAHGEMLVKGGHALLFDDYGHHPAEIQATLKAAKLAWPDRRVVLVFQPHRYTRTRDLMADFVNVLKTADQLVLTEVYAASEAKIAGADGRALFDAIQKSGAQSAEFVSELSQLPNALRDIMQPNDIVILQGAGDIVMMVDQLS